MKKNIKLLKLIKKAILAEPRRLEMGDWIDTSSHQSPCGTTACIAGWALILDQSKGRIPTVDTMKSTARIAYDNTYNPEDDARKLLGITVQQGNLLFFSGNWPMKFYEPYSRPYKTKDEMFLAKSKATARRIDYFIKTGK